jgi:hypothetical protein
MPLSWEDFLYQARYKMVGPCWQRRMLDNYPFLYFMLEDG